MFLTLNTLFTIIFKNSKKSKKPRTIIENVKTIHGNVKTPMILDDDRRISQFKKILKNKHILDFGCGNGGFLMGIKNYKSLSGVELRKDCISKIKRKTKKILETIDRLDSFARGRFAGSLIATCGLFFQVAGSLSM